MSRAKGIKMAEVPDGGTSETSEVSASVIVQDDDTMQAADCQGETAWDGENVPEVDGGAKGRHFGFVVYPSEAWIKANAPDCKYDGRDGWGTAPDDWTEMIRQTGLAFVVSPLHDKDTYLDAATGELVPKKPHWHVIVSWGNSTTYQSAAAIADMVNGPRPIALRQVVGYYRYFNHRDNPEKYQYEETPVAFNGWERPLDSDEVTRILRELTQVIFLTDCVEYAELVIEATVMGPEYQQVAENKTIYLGRVCDGMRWNPIRVIQRFLSRTPGLDAETVQMLQERVRQLQEAEAKKRESEGK